MCCNADPSGLSKGVKPLKPGVELNLETFTLMYHVCPSKTPRVIRMPFYVPADLCSDFPLSRPSLPYQVKKCFR